MYAQLKRNANCLWCTLLLAAKPHLRLIFPCRWTLCIFTARKRSLGQGNVFTPVCHSVYRGGGVMMSFPVMDSTTPWKAPPPYNTAPQKASPPWTATSLDSTNPLNSTTLAPPLPHRTAPHYQKSAFSFRRITITFIVSSYQEVNSFIF